MRRLRFAVESFLLGSGALLLVSSACTVGYATWLGWTDRVAFQRALDARDAAAAQLEPRPDPAPPRPELARCDVPAGPAWCPAGPVMSLRAAPRPAAEAREWSSARMQHFRDSRPEADRERLALLEIPSVDLQTVVLEGTSEWALNRGVGRIEGTALPEERGNLGIAGHRDGFFRALRNVKEGDAIRLRTPEFDRTYRVEWIRVVGKQDAWVLDPTADDALTLVTCYPFWYLGAAPQRYIVRARAERLSTRAEPLPR